MDSAIMYQASLSEDQPERNQYLKDLKERFLDLTLEMRSKGATDEDLNLFFATEPETFVQEAIDKWGLDYAIDLYNAALQHVIIVEYLANQQLENQE